MRAGWALAVCLGSCVSLGPAPGRSCEKPLAEVSKLLDGRQFEEAERAARKAIEGSPNSPDAHFSLAQVYVRRATLERLTVNHEALGLRPGESGTVTITDPEVVERAFQSEIVLDPQLAASALDTLGAILARWPGDQRSHLCMLELQQRLGESAAFLAALDRAARQLAGGGAHTVDALLPFANYYYERQQYDEAGRTLRTLLATFPKSGPLLSSYGATRVAQEQLEEALALFHRARAQAPDDLLILGNLANASLYLGRFETAEDALRARLGLRPDDTRILFELALVATAKDPAAAAPAWRRYLDRHEAAPDDASWAQFGVEALRMVEQRAGPEVFAGMAHSLTAADSRLAAALLQGLLARHPGDPSLHFFLAEAYEHGDLPATAFAQLQAAERSVLPPGKTSILQVEPASLAYESGRVALKVRRHADAARYLLRVSNSDPGRPNLQYLLGMAYHGLGDLGNARHWYESCLARPNNAGYQDYCRRNLHRIAAPASVQ